MPTTCTVRVTRLASDGWPADAVFDVVVPENVPMSTVFRPPDVESLSAVPWYRSDSQRGDVIFSEIMRAAEARTRELAMQKQVPESSLAANTARRTSSSTGAFLTVTHGVCSGSYDAVFISTDLEPDDIIAIKLMAPRLRGLPLMVVVGEGNMDDKRHVCARMLAAYGLDANTTILQGATSAAPYPSDLFAGYPDSIGACQLVPITSPAALGVHVGTFLRSHASPLALLLKPPHEMLAVAPEALRGTVCAAYGSFNLEEFRQAQMRKAAASGSAGAAGSGVAAVRGAAAQNSGGGASVASAEAAAWEQQERLLNAFKACLLIERSSSVGRDAVVDSSQAAIWPHLASDGALLQALRAWNAISVRTIAKRVSKFGEEVAAAFGDDDKAGSGAGDPAQRFRAVAAAFEKTDKKLAILRSIVDRGGLQTPLADPLVIAALLDEGGSINAYEVRCTLGHATGKLSYEPNASSHVALLAAQPKDQQKRLLAASLEVITKLARATAA